MATTRASEYIEKQIDYYTAQVKKYMLLANNCTSKQCYLGYKAAADNFQGKLNTWILLKQNTLKSHKESGQMIVLFLIAVVCIAIMLYMAYTGISQLAGTSSLFDTMIQSLSEVIK